MDPMPTVKIRYVNTGEIDVIWAHKFNPEFHEKIEEVTPAPESPEEPTVEPNPPQDEPSQEHMEPADTAPESPEEPTVEPNPPQDEPSQEHMEPADTAPESPEDVVVEVKKGRGRPRSTSSEVK